MLTDTAQFRSPHARSFALRAVVWTLGLFGLMRLGWVEAHAILPLTQFQAWVAERGFGVPALPVQVTLACSGADALALCAGFIFAYPALRLVRLAGAAGGIALILALNTVRIGTIGQAVRSPAWFEALHVYIWPALLVLAVAAYVFTWIRIADRRPVVTPASARVTSPTARFIWLTAMFVVLFVATSPLYYESAGVLAVASFVARVAASILSAFGIQATADANMMSTARGAFVVTQECISTPLIPVYCAGVAAYASTWPARAWGLLAAVPLFIGLGIARLLVVALPATLIGSPDFLIHAFYQLLLACVVVALAAFWRHGSAAATPRRAIAGMCAGTAFVYVFGAFYSTVVSRAAAMPAGLDDPQGAMAMLPSFQTGLYVALAAAAIPAAAWRPLLAGLALLVLSQVAFLSAVPFAEAQTGFALHVREVRAWALAGPILVIAVVNVYVRQRADRDGSRYRRFWAGVGERFPDLGLAASTRYYADNEQRLFTDHFPALAGLRILKTDLWDEAKNTRILAWASARGARAYGIDISAPTLTQARAAFHGDPLRCAVADVRHLPFQDGSFDAIYSMGTIEHFDETERAVREMARVLRPGGRAIVGVPNRHDPFLRPLFATLLQVTGLYAYGYEKSYSRRSLRQMLERAGLTVVEETAILFIPGWLRMLDLACHSWCRPMARFTGACVRPFVFLDRHVPAVRRHGYLLATVATKLEPPIGFVPSPARIRPFDV